MKLEQLKEMVRESPTYRGVLARVKEAAIAGHTSYTVTEKINDTIANRLREDGYTVEYHSDFGWVISGW